MSISYGGTPSTTQPVVLADATLIAIGRLIRAFAEIEEILTLFISALAKLNQSQAVIILSRAQLTRRLAMAEQLATIAGGEHLERFKACFATTEFKNAHACRNAMAHGILLGVDEDGMLAFLTDKTDAPDGSSTIQLAACYKPETIVAWSIWADNNVGPIAKTLGLQSWLKKHQPQSLLPHRKGRIPKGSGGRPKSPPQS